MGDPGKFEGAEDQDVAEILHDATLNGMHDEEAGDVNETGMWSAIFRGVEVRDGELQDGFPGGYIVQEDEQGFFTYTEFDSDEEIESSWEWILEQDRAWRGEEEEEDEDVDEIVPREKGGFDSDFGE
jgi:hypothetical protein